MKKIVSLVLCFSILLTVGLLYVSADTPTPYWTNTSEVIIGHAYQGNGRCSYQVIIDGYSGTTLIDNVDIKLYRIVTDSIMVLDGWKFNLSQTGDFFDYSGSFENVLTGYVYRLKVTADVHRNGTVESIDCYWDVQY